MQGKIREGVMGDAHDICERLGRARITAQNDDYSEIGSEERRRHVERLDAIDDGVIEIIRLRAALGPSPAGREG